jgi:hypothetical protein
LQYTPEQDAYIIRRKLDDEASFFEIATELGTTVDSVKWRWRSELKHRTYAPSHSGMQYSNVPPAPAEATGKPKKPEPFTPPPAYLTGNVTLTSRPDNTFVFGVVGDKHIGSKYHRDDVLADLYRRFEKAGVDAVFDTGNWIDGDARFNKHDVVVTGIDNQVRLMARIHPRINAPTYAVWGDDHEGWYAQREGIDVGKYAETIMQEEGHNWWDLGYMEAHVMLRNANTGKESRLAIMHPGGGSAYATSYRPQKIVESMEGGEKPAAIFMGHYHKLEALNVRNIWTLQTGCAEDQTPFMRKKSIEAHVGGAIVKIEQDPETGALIGFAPEMVRYFNKGYYNGRWSLTGNVNRVARAV